jgi:lambda family phage portal protein
MKQLPPVKQNILERAVGAIFPKWSFERLQYKQAINLFGSRKYDGAAKGRRTGGWVSASTSANSEIHSALTFLRNRSRELVRNNPYAGRAVKEIANNIVGTGILPTPKIDSKQQNKKIKAAWQTWAESTDCDYDGHHNMYGLQHLAARTVVESGEVIIRKRWDMSKPIPLQLQLLEADFIDTTKWQQKTDAGGFIYYGVEFNKEGKVVAYWLWDAHPGDQIQFNIKSNRVPADEVIHIFRKERPGQFRGVPWGHSVMLRLKDFDEYEDAQLVRQKIASCFTLFRTKTNVGPVAGLTTSTNDDRLDRVEPGIIEDMQPGEGITVASPPDAGATYDAYTKSVLRGIACGFDMDYVTLTGDLTGVNYSSGRMGWLMFHRNVEVWQWHMFIPTFCNKSWQWFIQVAAIKGYVKDQMVPVSWTTPARTMIDPAKEMEANKLAVRSGFKTWQEVIRELGYNPEDVMAEMKADMEAFDKENILVESDPRYEVKKAEAATAGDVKKAVEDAGN